MTVRGTYRSLFTLLISALVALFTLAGSVYTAPTPVTSNPIEQIDGSSKKLKPHLRVNLKAIDPILDYELNWLMAEFMYSTHCRQISQNLQWLDYQRNPLLSFLPKYSDNRREPPLLS